MALQGRQAAINSIHHGFSCALCARYLINEFCVMIGLGRNQLRKSVYLDGPIPKMGLE